MRRWYFFTGSLWIVVVILGSSLVGCSFGPQATPTADPATALAAAVEALHQQLTAEALSNPSPTPAPTNTPLPSATPIPPTPTLTPTVTNTPAPAIAAEFLSAGTFPENRTEFIPNETFGVAVRFLNTGTAAWQPGFQLQLVSFEGEVTVQKEAELGQGVEPGKAAEFDLWAFGSELLGRHIWYFQLYTPQGVAVPGGSAMFTYVSK